MKKIKINGQEFTIEQLNELIEQAKEPQHWTEKLVQPIEEEYCYIEDDMDKCFHICKRKYSDRKPQHAFKTEEQAQIVAEKCTLMVEMHNFAHAMNDGWIPDWDNLKETKFGLGFTGGFQITNSNYYNYFLFGIAVKSQEIAEKMLKEFKDRLEIYNQQF